MFLLINHSDEINQEEWRDVRRTSRQSILECGDKKLTGDRLNVIEFDETLQRKLQLIVILVTDSKRPSSLDAYFV